MQIHVLLTCIDKCVVAPDGIDILVDVYVVLHIAACTFYVIHKVVYKTSLQLFAQC